MNTASKVKGHHDGQLTLAVGSSRFEKSWKNKSMQWAELVQRLSQTTRTGETLAEYKKLSKPQQDKIKDVGGFVGGTLKGGRRKTDAVKWRQIVTLDADHLKDTDLWETIELLYDNAMAVYSTHKHEPNNKRLRLVIPLSRPVTADEYQAVSRKIADDMGIDYFDDTTYQPHRLMYYPSTSNDGEFFFRVMDGEWVDPDPILASYEDWRDPSYWAESSRQQNVRKRMAAKQGDPLEKPGMVGAFCRTYSVTDVLEDFLSDVYEPTGDGRYTYMDGSTNGGLVLYEGEKFAYSHHGTDPVSGLLVNAFDLLRIHKFGLQDDDIKPDTAITEKPSYKAMLALVEFDEKVIAQKDAERDAAIEEDFAGENVNPVRLFFNEKRFIPAFMGEWFLKGHQAFVMNSDLFVYQDGVYIKGERYFHERATAALGVEFQPKRLADALAYIKNTVQELSPQEAVTEMQYLNVRNGLLDLKTLEFIDHSPEIRMLSQLPINYDPGASSKHFDQFLKQVVPGDAIPVVEEMAGYCLVPSMKYEKALVLYGEGGNGKGTLIALLTALLGHKNIAGVSFQDLSENRFASAELFGKMANLHADIPSKVLDNSSRFKELVSGDMIRAEEKHKAPFSFQNRAKLIFSANEPPTSKDNTEGFHRRLLMVPFPHKFNDRELRSNLFNSEALSGALNRIIEGLHRLLKQDRFTTSESVDLSLDEYRKASDSVARFIDECCEMETDEMAGKQELYNAYRLNCADWGNHPLSQTNFNKRLKVLCPDLGEYRKTSPRRWKGISIKEADEFI